MDKDSTAMGDAFTRRTTHPIGSKIRVPRGLQTRGRGRWRPGTLQTDSSGRWTLMVSPLPLAMPLSITTKSMMPGRLALPGPFCASIGLMTDNHDLHVEVRGDYIIITLPGTKFMVSYYKVGDPPQVMTKSVWTDDPDAPVTLGAFRARAWIAANDKARELGWIV